MKNKNMTRYNFSAPNELINRFEQQIDCSRSKKIRQLIKEYVDENNQREQEFKKTMNEIKQKKKQISEERKSLKKKEEKLETRLTSLERKLKDKENEKKQKQKVFERFVKVVARNFDKYSSPSEIPPYYSNNLPVENDDLYSIASDLSEKQNLDPEEINMEDWLESV